MSEIHSLSPRAGGKPAQPSPLRVLQRLCWRFRSSPAPQLGVDVMQEQLARQERATAHCVAESVKIEGSLQLVRTAMAAALADAATPGVITPVEAERIARQLLRPSAEAHAHTKHLSALL